MEQNVNTEIGRAGNFKRLARDGVNQRKLHRAELVIRRMILRRQIGGFCREVARIAKQRMADVRHVYAQLVRASRDGEEPNERDIAKGRFHPIARHGALAAGQNRAGEAVRRDADQSARRSRLRIQAKRRRPAQGIPCERYPPASAAGYAPAHTAVWRIRRCPSSPRRADGRGARRCADSFARALPACPRRAGRKERDAPARAQACARQSARRPDRGYRPRLARKNPSACRIRLKEWRPSCPRRCADWRKTARRPPSSPGAWPPAPPLRKARAARAKADRGSACRWIRL